MPLVRNGPCFETPGRRADRLLRLPEGSRTSQSSSSLGFPETGPGNGAELVARRIVRQNPRWQTAARETLRRGTPCGPVIGPGPPFARVLDSSKTILTAGNATRHAHGSDGKAWLLTPHRQPRGFLAPSLPSCFCTRSLRDWNTIPAGTVISSGPLEQEASVRSSWVSPPPDTLARRTSPSATASLKSTVRDWGSSDAGCWRESVLHRFAPAASSVLWQPPSVL